MFLVGLMSWWYGRGYLETLQRMKRLFEQTYDLFSIGILLETLFVPFRQISAPENDSWLSKLSDGLISRGIGFVIRSVMICIGLIVLLFIGLYSICVAVFWAILPIVPVAAAICYALEVTVW